MRRNNRERRRRSSHRMQNMKGQINDDMTEADKRWKMIAQILEEERICYVLCADSIERNLVRQSKSDGEHVTKAA
eukprot:10005411-Ditylum_brightwellii.AAC.1